MKEFICMSETVAQTQKAIRQWLSTGYTIDLISQSSTHVAGEGIIVVTSLFRTKSE